MASNETIEEVEKTIEETQEITKLDVEVKLYGLKQMSRRLFKSGTGDQRQFEAAERWLGGFKVSWVTGRRERINWCLQSGIGGDIMR